MKKDSEGKVSHGWWNLEFLLFNYLNGDHDEPLRCVCLKLDDHLLSYDITTMFRNTHKHKWRRLDVAFYNVACLNAWTLLPWTQNGTICQDLSRLI